MLLDVVSSDAVSVNKRFASPEEAIKYSGELLKNIGCCNGGYIDGMLRNFKENGPYFVIAPGVALPHANPEEGALKNGLSFIVLDKPIEFGNKHNDPVKLIIGLSSVDSDEHLNSLSKLVEILSDEDLVNKLKTSKTKDDVLEVLGKK